MMLIETIIPDIRRSLLDTFQSIDKWFDKEAPIAAIQAHEWRLDH